MKALAYLLGARGLDVARDADSGIRWPKPEERVAALASTPASAAAWRRWRNGHADAATPTAETTLRPAGGLSPTGA
jgi:hypothetical protein